MKIWIAKLILNSLIFIFSSFLENVNVAFDIRLPFDFFHTALSFAGNLPSRLYEKALCVFWWQVLSNWLICVFWTFSRQMASRYQNRSHSYKRSTACILNCSPEARCIQQRIREELMERPSSNGFRIILFRLLGRWPCESTTKILKM